MEITACLVLLLGLLAPTDCDCPNRCKCYIDKISCNEGNFQQLPLNTYNTTEELVIIRANLSVLSKKLFNDAGFFNLKRLRLEYTNITRLTEDAFDTLGDLESLILSHNKNLFLNALNPIRTLKYLVKLDLSFNGIASLPFNLLQGLGIRDLDLSSNLITFLPVHIFSGMINLNNCLGFEYNTLRQTTLNLSHNSINFIIPGTFKGLCAYSILDLSFNFIRALNPDTFVGLSRLRNLDLRINDLTTLQTGVFNNLDALVEIQLIGYHKELTILDMKNAFSGHVTRDDFENLRFGIIKHFLERNSISSIGPDAFRNLSKINKLILATSCIGHFSYEMLRGMTSLRFLSLNQTCIETVKPGVFKDFSNLNHLDLSNNRIETLYSGAILDLENLRILDLGFNKIQKIETDAFIGLKKLEILDLIKNNIQDITPDTFDGLQILRILNLPYNNISSIEPDAFKSLHLLTYLSLANNNIKTISSITFNLLNRLEMLDLTENRELTIKPGDLKELQVMKTIGLSVKEVALSNITARAILKGLLEGVHSFRELKVSGLFTILYQGDFVGFNLLTFQISKCIIPYILSDTFFGLSSLNTLKFNSNLLKFILPGSFKHLYSLKYLSLAHNKIVDLEEGIFEDLKNLEILEIHDNKIQNLSVRVFGGWCRYDGSESNAAYMNDSKKSSNCDVLESLENVRVITLSVNEISGIHPDTFIYNKRLEVLDLSYNRRLSTIDFLFIPSLLELQIAFCNISVLPDDAFKWTPKLKSLYLPFNRITTLNVETFRYVKDLLSINIYQNPLDCNCDVLKVWHWIRNKRVDTFEVFNCDDIGVNLWSETISDIQCNNSDYEIPELSAPDDLQFFKQYLEPLILGLVLLVGVLGNGFLVFVFIRNPKMCSGPNMYIVNLTISDFLTLLLNLPLSYWDILNGSWELGLDMCRLFMGMRDLTVGVTVFSVVALGIQRYRITVQSLSMKRGMFGMSEKKTMILSIFLVWFLALGSALPAFLSAIVERRCFYSPYGIQYNQRVWTFQLFVYCIIPVLTILFLYIRTYQHLKQSVKDMPGEVKSTPQAEGRLRVANMVLALTVVFCISFTPNFVLRVLFVWYILDTKSIATFFASFVSFCLFFCNSCFNPIALICMSTAFKEQFFRYARFGRRTATKSADINDIPLPKFTKRNDLVDNPKP